MVLTHHWKWPLKKNKRKLKQLKIKVHVFIPTSFQLLLWLCLSKTFVGPGAISTSSLLPIPEDPLRGAPVNSCDWREGQKRDLYSLASLAISPKKQLFGDLAIVSIIVTITWAPPNVSETFVCFSSIARKIRAITLIHHPAEYSQETNVNISFQGKPRKGRLWSCVNGNCS